MTEPKGIVMEMGIRYARPLLAAIAFLAAAAPAAGQSSVSDVKRAVDSTIAVERATQERKEQWASERNELIARFKTAKASSEFLGARKTSVEERLAAVEKGIVDLDRSLAESKRLERNLQDTLNSLHGRLERAVRLDLPFLIAEREARLASLKSAINRPPVSGGEKLRRLLEALQVETTYGNTVDVAQERIAVGTDSLFVDVLRVGRVSLFWRATDGKRVGEYDRATQRWVELPRKHSRDIGLAMDMALRTRPVEIVTLPIGRIRP
jgi:septal ring factor EnvC (AmiA/AmiB activator)